MIIKKFHLFEGKNSGDLYHSPCWFPEIDFNKPLDNSAFNKIFANYESIINKGLKFSDQTSQIETFKSNKDYLTKKTGKNINLYGNIRNYNYFISVTRDKMMKKNTPHPIIFVLDGNSISDNYKIIPFNLNALSDINSTLNSEIINKLSIPNSKIMSIYNSRYASEERILSKSPGYLDVKYIKGIILKNLNKEQLDKILNILPQNIKIISKPHIL